MRTDEPEAEELAQKAALEASQKADNDRAVAELGTLLPDLGYTGWAMGNGYYAVYDSSPFALLGTEGSARLLFTGRLDEVKTWLERQ